jgi:hypothetical protein
LRERFEKFPIARLFSGRMLYNILWKTLLFSAVSLLFRFVDAMAYTTTGPRMIVRFFGGS